MTLEESLLKTFASNFVVYYKAHASHVNITGRNFYSDHKLLKKVYEDRQEEIDKLGELLRTIQVEMPEKLSEIMDLSQISDDLHQDISTGYLDSVLGDLTMLITVFTELDVIASEHPVHSDLANYAQDQIRQLHKWCWQINATLTSNIIDINPGFKLY